ncbi:arginine repressor [Peptococcus simiae]|uniref:arginine repressor n=1 Tax=Peptococcus simiae TaxID=1643805 RepID=UPI0039815E52
MNKRQRRILELVLEQQISTQKELAERLREEGYQITQATVSRDIKELQLVKVPIGGDQYKYGRSQDSVPGESKLRMLFREFVLSYDSSENLVIINTPPGNANTIAYFIDRLGWPEVIGTIAGDDTIMLICKPKEAVPVVIGYIEHYINN